MKKHERGITIIALIITIIIIIILSGITISYITGENGILEKARNARDKALLAQNDENIAITETDNRMNQYIDGNREGISTRSNLIPNASLNISQITNVGFKCSLNVETANINNILDYHIYVINTKDTTKNKSYAKNTNEVTLNDLESSTTYQVYAIICDINGEFRKTDKVEVTTYDQPVLTINNVYAMETMGAVTNSIQTISGYLFDGNINNGGAYNGVLFNLSSYIEITITKNIKINAYGHTYSDSRWICWKEYNFSKI